MDIKKGDVLSPLKVPYCIIISLIHKECSIIFIQQEDCLL